MVGILLAGAGLYFVLYSGHVSTQSQSSANGSSSTTTQAASSSLLGPNGVPLYDCPKPSANSELFCDILPTGYAIAPREVNSPPAYCLANMSAAACGMLKTTQGNGVCDPNETPDTAALDCGCTGALIPDPYQGRCASPASVCLLQQQQQGAKAGG